MKLSAQRWREVSPLLDRALALEGDEREAFLEEVRSRDESLATDLRDVLSREAALGRDRFLETGAPFGAYLPTKPEAVAGSTLDAYTLDAPLGSGGMGTVWLARRSDGTYDGKVAVKLIRAALGSERVLLRFEAERRTLGRLDHPNIARVLDAGSAADGSPFFAMEYVEGRSLHEYCDEERLSVRARLALFLDVCAGVRHAHRNGIIHRDLKPSNILVAEGDGRAVPKIIDFGIAKAVGPGVEEATVTREGEWIGTPAYMSPEQFGGTGSGLDTRSDVYSLGVILHELLVGVRPPPSRTPAGGETEAPASPSACFADLREEREAIAARRSTDPAGLAHAVRGDLDRIVLEAVARDPDDRYESVAALAEDVRAHLEDRPVRAGRESGATRMRKFARRHRAAVAAGTIALAAVVSGGVIATVGYARAVAAERKTAVERDRANREATTANRTLAALTDIFEVSDPGESRGQNVTAREILDRGAAKVQAEMKDEPVAQAKILETLGGVYRHLGLYESAKALLERSAALRREALGEKDPETLGARREVALVLWEQGKLHDAEALLRDVHASCESALGGDNEETLRVGSDLALVLQAEGKFAEAEPLARQVLEGKRRADPSNDGELLPTMSVLGLLLQQQGKYAEAEPYLREVVERATRAWGRDHQNTLISLNNLGLVLQAQGKPEEAEAYWREVLEARRRVLGKDHTQTLNSVYNMATLLRALGRLDEAEPLYHEALEGYRKALGEDAPATIKAVAGIGGLRQAQRRWKEAEALDREALAKRRRVLGDDHLETIDSMTDLGVVLTQTGRLTEAETLLREASDRATRALGPESPSKLAASVALGDVLTLRKSPEAESLLRQTLASAREKLPPTHRTIGKALRSYGRCLTTLGRYPEAEAALLESHAQLAKSSPVNAREVAEHLADLYARWGKPEKASEWKRKAA